MAWLNENEIGFVMARPFAEVGASGDRIAARGCRRVFMRITLSTLVPKNWRTGGGPVHVECEFQRLSCQLCILSRFNGNDLAFQ
jgi:hypothetical protein